MTGSDGKSAQRSVGGWIKALVLAGVFASIVSTSSVVSAQAPSREVVADVAVVGNRTIGTERILRYVTHTRKGKDFSTADVQADIAALAESRLFRAVGESEQRTGDGRVTVIIQVTEFPNIVTDIIFKNANHIPQTELDNLRIRKGMPLDPTTNRNACYEIQDFYKRKGRYFATVTLEEGSQTTDTRVVFNITEGPIVRVRSVNFKGNEQLAKDDRLRTQMETSRAFLGALGGTFVPQLVDGDAIKLEEYYKANGFLMARVQRELKFSSDFQFVDVVYHISEGQRYRIQDVQIEGTSAEKRQALSGIVQAKQGEFYSENTVGGDIANIQAYEGYRGYPSIVQKQLYTVPDQPNVVRVQYEVKERPPSTVGQVFIVGNDVTDNRVILRVLGLYPGQTLRYPELKAAERDLARLNIFKMKPEEGIRPTVSVLDPDSESPVKDILVQVQEDHTGQLMLGAGINSDAGLVGSIVLNERNFDITRFPTSVNDIWEGRAFRGAGQEFRLEAVPGTQLQRYTASFREPFLFDRPYSLGVSGYYWDRAYNEDTETRFGGRVSLSHQLTKEWGITGSVRIEDVDISHLAGFPPAPDYVAALGSHFIFAPRIGATYDTRDSFLRPTQGGTVETSYEQVLGSYTFPILSVEGSRYFTVTQRADGSGKQVVAVHSQVSWAGEEAPVFERFYGGGYRSLRGFEFRGVGPFVNGQAVGGDFMFLNSIEYQVPVMANDNLNLVAFVDSGTIESNVSLRDYRVSAGVGLRIAVPALGPVPIALDFGFPIMRGPHDKEQVVSFYVGLFR